MNQFFKDRSPLKIEHFPQKFVFSDTYYIIKKIVFLISKHIENLLYITNAYNKSGTYLTGKKLYPIHQYYRTANIQSLPKKKHIIESPIHSSFISLSYLFAANKNNFSGESGESTRSPLNKQSYFTFSCIREIMFIFATKILAIINRRRLYSARIVGGWKNRENK